MSRAVLHDTLPFSLFAGEDDAKRALILSAITPYVRGVLIQGACGTGKSTLIRAFSRLVSDVPFVTLPLSVTEDRVLSSRVYDTRTNAYAYEQGLIARAKGGFLFIDDIHLLSPVIARHLHTARACVPLATIADDDALSPALRARFTLYARLQTERDTAARAARTEHLFAYGARCDEEKNEDAVLRARIHRAKERFPAVVVSRTVIERIAEACANEHTKGHTRDIVTVYAAKANAAFEARTHVTEDDVRVALRLTREREQEENAVPEAHQEAPSHQENERQTHADTDNAKTRAPSPSSTHRGDTQGEHRATIPREIDEGTFTHRDEVFPIGVLPGAVPHIPVNTEARARNARTGSGRAQRTLRTESTRGRAIRVKRPTSSCALRDIAFAATIRETLLSQGCAAVTEHALRIRRDDIRVNVRVAARKRVILFVVDGSGSMAAGRRIEETKGVILSFLRHAYITRDMVGMMVFRNERAEMILPPTRSGARAARLLRAIPTGGKTPLSDAIIRAVRYYLGQRAKGDALYTIVFVTDGRATSPEGRDETETAYALAKQVRNAGCAFVVVDTEGGPIRLGRAKALADALTAFYLPQEALFAKDVSRDRARGYTR